MRVRELRLRNFRCYEEARLVLGDGLTVVSGPNGAGKTNLLEGLYFACTGRSCRTASDRELVRFGAGAARTALVAVDEVGEHELSVGFVPGQPKRMKVDGAPVGQLGDSPHRPLVSVFLPDRLELIKGGPGLRRAHLDQLVAALRPAGLATRRAYAQALAQRNALLVRVRSRMARRADLADWEMQLAEHGIALMEDRERATEALRERFAELAEGLGLAGGVEVDYRPRSPATGAEALARELADRRDGDIERGFTSHGPHRDELAIRHRGRELRVYGSQGEQRLALLALLLAEREALAEARRRPPVMLLDDVMSELDVGRRHALVGLLGARAAQSVITTADPELVPWAGADEPRRVAVEDGRLAPLEVVG